MIKMYLFALSIGVSGFAYGEDLKEKVKNRAAVVICGEGITLSHALESLNDQIKVLDTDVHISEPSTNHRKSTWDEWAYVCVTVRR